jgi:hypothetical protein
MTGRARALRILAGVLGVLLILAQLTHIPPRTTNTAEGFGFLVGWFLMLALGWTCLMYSLGRTFSGKRETK